MPSRLSKGTNRSSARATRRRTKIDHRPVPPHPALYSPVQERARWLHLTNLSGRADHSRGILLLSTCLAASEMRGEEKGGQSTPALPLTPVPVCPRARTLHCSSLNSTPLPHPLQGAIQMWVYPAASRGPPHTRNGAHRMIPPVPDPGF